MGWKRVNRPVPTKNQYGDELPELCIDVVAPRFGVRVLREEEVTDVLGGENVIWVPDRGKGMQPVLQIVALPSTTAGIPDRLLDMKVGDLFISGGSGFCVPTNWKHVEVFLIDPNVIIAFLREKEEEPTE